MNRRGDARAVALVTEVIGALSGHGSLLCQPTIENDDGVHSLHVTFRPTSDHQALELLEMCAALQRVQDFAQIRAFAELYQIEPRALEAVIGQAVDDRDRDRPTLNELTAIVDALESSRFMPKDEAEAALIYRALPKLKAMIVAEVF